jgi:lycopene cyclase domain-containing protein
MTYTQIALIAVFIAAFIDLEVLRTKLLKRKVFWTSYAIIVPFQLLTNWWLTSKEIVMYSEDAILGIRIASAPAEDLFFGFALILSVMSGNRLYICFASHSHSATGRCFCSLIKNVITNRFDLIDNATIKFAGCLNTRTTRSL